MTAADRSFDAEVLRPVWHFTPRAGWMNDPNGPIWRDGRYHLFYQHNPDAPVWGNLHWGHATSTDLVEWTHEPIALRPDANGLMFSGCIVDDVDDSAGLGAGAMVAVLTQDQDGYQVQSLAFSNDDGTSWTPFEDNPVLEPPEGQRDFRDPSVIAIDGGWLMVLAVGSEIWSYRSTNLRSWELAEKLRPTLPHTQSIIEVPALVSVPVRGSDRDQWLLLFSVEPPRGTTLHGRQVHWSVVEVAGRNLSIASEPELVDAGESFYAALCWSATAHSGPQLIGWMDERKALLPDRPWCGRQSLVRALTLEERDTQLVLHQAPALWKSECSSRQAVAPRDVLRLPADVGAWAVHINTTSDGGRIEAVRLVIDSGAPDETEHPPVTLTVASEQVAIEGVPAGDIRWTRSSADAGELVLVFDVGSLETFVDDGRHVASSFVALPTADAALEVHNDGSDELTVDVVAIPDGRD